MPKDLFADTTTQETAPSAGPRDLFAEQMDEPSAAPQIEEPTEGRSSESSILKTMGKGVGGLALGTLQGLSDMGYGLAELGDKAINTQLDLIGLNPLMEKLTGKKIDLQAPRGDIYYGPAEHLKGTLPAKVGEDVIAPIAGTALGGEAAAGLGKAGTLLPKALGYGATAAATTPGDMPKRTMAGVLGGVGGSLEHFMGSLPFMFKGKLASKLENVSKQQKEIGSALYDEAFKGTEKLTPQISPTTYHALNDLLEAWPTKSSPARKALDVFNKNRTLKNMHILRSDLSKIESKFADKALKSGLSGDDMSKTEALDKVINNLSSDLEEHFGKLNPEQHHKFQIAQKHWAQNVVPFRQFASIRKLLSPDREVSPRLYTDLTKDSKGAKKLRALLKTNVGSLQLARVMHHKVLGLPLPAYLGLGGGFGLYHLKALGGQ